MNAIEIPVDQLDDSPFQPRATYSGIDDMASSMKELGVLQALLVRTHRNLKARETTPYEIVAGHRRIRAARKAGLQTVPCDVRELTDQEVKEAILIENGQRVDVPPIEELAIYVSLRDDGMEPEEIAARIGRPVGYVYRRLQLQNLCSNGCDAVAAGELKLGIAELVARLPDHDTQVRAVDRLKRGTHSEPTIAHAKEFIERECMMILKHADFDTTRDDLIGEAGACTDCPKNTAVSVSLFPEMTDDARCTDSKCFGEKRDALWNERCIQAKEDGVEVLDVETTKKAFQHGHLHQSWIDLDETRWVNTGKEGSSNKKWRSILGKKRIPEKVHLARHPYKGTIHFIVKKKDVKKKVAAAPKDTDPSDVSTVKSEHELKGDFDRKAQKAFEHLVLSDIRRALEKKRGEFDSVAMWRLLAHGAIAIARSWAATVSSACKRRHLNPNKENHESPVDVLQQYVDGLVHGGEETIQPATVYDLQVLVFELLVVPEFEHWKDSKFLQVAYDFFDIDEKERRSDAEESVEIGIQLQADKKAAKKAGVDMDSYRLMKANSLEELQKLKDEGMSYSAIGEKVGLSKHQVSRRLKFKK